MEPACPYRECRPRLGAGWLGLVPLGRQVPFALDAYPRPPSGPFGTASCPHGLVRVHEPTARVGRHDRELTFCPPIAKLHTGIPPLRYPAHSHTPLGHQPGHSCRSRHGLSPPADHDRLPGSVGRARRLVGRTQGRRPGPSSGTCRCPGRYSRLDVPRVLPAAYERERRAPGNRH